MFSTTTDGSSHLRRYLTTLGVAVIVGSLSGASLLLRDSALLSFKQADLSQLTPAAQQTIDRRQHYLLFITTHLPWIVGIGVVCGTLLVSFGLYGWIRRQQISDEREDHDLAKSRYEIRKLTSEEVQQKQEREADEILEASPPSPEPEVVYVGVPESGRSHSAVDVATSGTRPHLLNLIQRLEHLLIAKLTVAFSDAQVTAGIRVGDLAVDAVAVDQEAKSGYVINVKYSRGSLGKNLGNRLEETISLASASVHLSSRYGFQVRPVLMMVVADEIAVPPRSEVLGRLVNVAAAFSVGVLVIVMTESAFSNLDAHDLRNLLTRPARTEDSVSVPLRTDPERKKR